MAAQMAANKEEGSQKDEQETFKYKSMNTVHDNYVCPICCWTSSQYANSFLSLSSCVSCSWTVSVTLCHVKCNSLNVFIINQISAMLPVAYGTGHMSFQVNLTYSQMDHHKWQTSMVLTCGQCTTRYSYGSKA